MGGTEEKREGKQQYAASKRTTHITKEPVMASSTWNPTNTNIIIATEKENTNQE
jgi:hypothetical protein